MRNLFLTTLLYLLSQQIHPQTIKVTGTTGDQYNFITHFDGHCFTVLRNDGYAVIDLNGKAIMTGIKAPVYGMIRQPLPLYHGTIFVEDANNIVLKNTQGQPLGTGKYTDILPFTTDNTVVRLPSPLTVWIVAYLDTNGKEILRFDVRKYLALVDPPSKSGGYTFITLDDFLPFSQGLTPIKSPITGKCGYINKKMELAIPATFKDARPFSDGLAAVQNMDGIWGFINTAGKLVIPYTYALPPSRFMSGRAKVESQEGKFGYINQRNEVVIQPTYTFATHFYKGYALARENFQQPTCLIDTTGTVVATFPKELIYIDNPAPPPGISGNREPEYPFYISPTLQQLVDEGKGIFQKGFSYGLMDNHGKPALDFKYAYLTDYHNGKLAAYLSSTQTGIIDDQGNWIIQIVPSQF